MSATPAEIKPKFQSAYPDNGVPGQLSPNDWNESRLAAGGATGDLFMRDTASTTGASWLTPDFESSGDVAAGDAATLASANAHSDANDTTTLSSAHTYADSGDSATLTAANSHSDSHDATTLASANSHADAGDATTLTSANSHADDGDATTLAAANTHSDEGVSGLFTGSAVGAIGLSTGSAFNWLADMAAGSYLRSAGAGIAPAWSAVTLPNAATTGDVLIATGANAIGRLADVATGSVLVSGGVGVAPAWSATPTLTDVTLTGQVKGASGTAAAPSIAMGNATTGLYSNFTNEMSLAFGGNARTTLTGSTWRFGASVALGWSSATDPTGSPSDVILVRDGANILAQRNGTNAQTLRLYNTLTDLNNFERISVRWTSNVAIVTAEALGTGTVRPLVIGQIVAVASLPTASAAAKGARAFVTDANATTFQSIVAAGGSNNVPVFCDGTNWRIG